MNGVEVAKDAAKIILLEKNLAVLNDGIIEGRRCFANIMKYIVMGTSSNFGNMFSMAAASLFLPFLPMLPTQILLNNLLYDVSQISIPSDNVDPALLHRPKRWQIGFIRQFMMIIGQSARSMISSRSGYFSGYFTLRRTRHYFTQVGLSNRWPHKRWWYL